MERVNVLLYRYCQYSGSHLKNGGRGVGGHVGRGGEHRSGSRRVPRELARCHGLKTWETCARSYIEDSITAL
jgi:hypothetical protein